MCKAHSLVYHSTLGLRVIKKKTKVSGRRDRSQRFGIVRGASFYCWPRSSEKSWKTDF